MPIPAVDLAYQVRAGDEILRSGLIPAVDTYTFTVAGTPWMDQQWLAQVLLALGFRAGGWELLVVLRAALVSASFGLLATMEPLTVLNCLLMLPPLFVPATARE